MRRAAFIASVVASASLAHAWGGEGHQVVALIAQIHLTPAAKAGVIELLGKDVHIYDADVASWADRPRREDRTTADWHFVDIPVEADGYDEERDGRTKAGKPRDNLVHALNDPLAVLTDKTADKQKRVEALKWVVHLVGDAEQPLHCAIRGHDAGGNGCKGNGPAQTRASRRTCTRSGTRRCCGRTLARRTSPTTPSRSTTRRNPSTATR